MVEIVEKPNQYRIEETGKEPFKFMVVDSEGEDHAVAFCMKRETAEGYMQQLNETGFIEI